MQLLTADLGKFLPEHLRERTRLFREMKNAGQLSGEFVLYWLHHAMRAHENPALDVALTVSHNLNLPLLVYQSLPEDYPYASDRHHTFILEGARDLQHQFGELGIEYVFHLERQGHRGRYLPEMCRRAAVVITEEMPVDPVRTWTDRLVSTTEKPILCVDTACVVPMQVVGKAYHRAFQFRNDTKSQYAKRLRIAWEDVEPSAAFSTAASIVSTLAFEPLCLSDGVDLARIISECEIDHAIGPVPHTRGGSSAGYERWNKFRANGLSAYAKRRTDPLIDGTSRLSPYLHYGMVSPLRIAREAADTAVAEKFLDELLVWRELAYAFCFFFPNHEGLGAIPDWARETLVEHQSDRRAAIQSWETLARGKTGDQLWDAAQRSLLIHGELHNNVRMTWGKALLGWTPDAESALATMIDLNHRYALDGQDPASYGGILWCLGQFDRPFPPARPIFGTVRDRSTREHARRLDPQRYGNQTMRPLCEPIPKIAVVGAGISGLMCARTLADHGMEVTVFEKSRGVGGRMATRRTEEGLQFDHGAQYFTVRDDRFERYVRSWIQDGLAVAWEGRICTLTRGEVDGKETTTPRFVGVPMMNAICRHLAADLNIQFRVRVGSPQLADGIWHMRAEQGDPLGNFDYVVVSAPAAQAAGLLEAATDLQREANTIAMNGCWATMLSFDRSLELPFDGAFVHDSPLSWICRNDSKPQRVGDQESWVLHASPEWTMARLENEQEQVLAEMIDAFWQATGSAPKQPRRKFGHRWRYAIPSETLESRCLFDPERKIGACGDWCGGPRVEGAFLSGMAMAGRVLTSVTSAL